MIKNFCFAILLSACCASLSHAARTYAFDLRDDDNLFSFPADNPNMVTAVNSGPTAWATYGLDFNAAGDTLYAVNHADAAAGLTLGTVDTSNGTFTPVASILDAAGEPLSGDETGLSVDPTDNSIYLSTGAQLFTLDASTGVATLVGRFSGMDPDGTAISSVIDIAIDNNGDLFAFDIGTDSLWSVDMSTAAATHVAASELDASYAQGMDFDPTTNVLYSAIYMGSGNGSYGKWDLTNGVFTEVLDLPSFGSVELEIAITVPEPSGGVLSLLCLGGLGLIRCRRQR